MDIGSVSSSTQSAQDMGDLLRTIASEKNDLSNKLINVNVEQKVQNEKLGNMADFLA
jgi:hypothetical protein